MWYFHRQVCRCQHSTAGGWANACHQETFWPGHHCTPDTLFKFVQSIQQDSDFIRRSWMFLAENERMDVGFAFCWFKIGNAFSECITIITFVARWTVCTALHFCPPVACLRAFRRQDLPGQSLLVHSKLAESLESRIGIQAWGNSFSCIAEDHRSCLMSSS